MSAIVEAGGGCSQGLAFIAMSLGLLLQLAGQTDLWLPLLISVGSVLMSPPSHLLLWQPYKRAAVTWLLLPIELQALTLLLRNTLKKKKKELSNGPAVSTSCC